MSVTSLSTLNIFPRSMVASLGAAMFAAALLVVLDRGYGAGDIGVFFVWTLPLALGVGVIGMLLNKLHIFRISRLKYIVMALSGAALGVMWTIAVSSILGAWFGAFSFSVLICWIAGSASGLISTVLPQSDKPMKQITISVLIISVICSTAGIVVRQISALISGAQILEVVFVEWMPSSDPLFIGSLGIRVVSPISCGSFRFS